MKKARKSLSLILAMVMILSIIVIAPTTASAESYEYAMYPGDVLQMTQGAYAEYNAYSHNGQTGYVQNAFDMVGNSVYKAPFTGTIVKIGSSLNVVAVASENKVYWADGTLDYLTVYFMHDNNISDITDGARITQGTPFYHPGTAGGATGSHLHIYARRGRLTAKNMYGGSGDVYVNNALYIKNTTSVVQTGGYSWKTAPTVTTPTLTSNFSGNKVNSANDIIFSWSTVSSNMSGYNLYVAKNIAGTVNYDWNNGRIYCPGVSTNRFTIDKGKLSAGNYAAFVQAINIDTNEKSPQSNYIFFVVEDSIISDIHTPYDGITIDLSENNFLSIRGWALNTGRYEVDCYATIDEGEELFLQKSERTDVSTSPLYSCYCSNSNVGFQSQIDISELSGGQHNLKIIAKSTSVNAIIADYSFTIINKTEPTATQQTTVEPTEPTSNGPTQPTTVKATETIEPTQSTTKPTEITEPTTKPTQPTTVKPTVPTACNHSKVWTSTIPSTYFAKGKKTIYCAYCGKVIKKTTLPKDVLQTPSFTVKPSKGSVIVKYKKVKDAKGFVLDCKIGKRTFTKRFKTNKSKAVKFNGIKKGTKVSVWIKAYTTSGSNKAYSYWSKKKVVWAK